MGSVTFVDTVSRIFSDEVDMDTYIARNRPSFIAKRTKIVTLLNNIAGSAKSGVIRRKINVQFNDEEILPQDMPWKKIETSIHEFSTWFDKHAHVFRMDDTFARSEL